MQLSQEGQNKKLFSNLALQPQYQANTGACYHKPIKVAASGTTAVQKNQITSPICLIFIIIVALSDAKTKVENMKIAVNVLEDEKRI